jgi:hypothetical protein
MGLGTILTKSEKSKIWGGTSKKCDADKIRLCSKVKPGGGRTHDCLEEHKAELSDECRYSTVLSISMLLH